MIGYLRSRKDLKGRLYICVAILQIAIGALLVWHGWSGTPANLYPFLFGLWMLLDVRLWFQTEVIKASFFWFATHDIPDSKA